MNYKLFFLLLAFGPLGAWAQENEVHGFVFWDNPDPAAESRHFAVANAVVLWADGSGGGVTDSTGHFELSLPPRFPAKLIVRAAGFQDREFTFPNATHTTIQVWKPGEAGAEGSLSANEGRENQSEEHPETGAHENHFHGVVGQVLAVEDTTQLENPEPLAGASIRWLGERQGRLSDEDGRFEIPNPTGGYPGYLIVFFPNYHTDTVPVERAGEVRVVLLNMALPEVVITARRRSTILLTTETMQTELITAQELTHAACCNLSEAFETNTHVDVNYTDAVTGAKEIQMLGLAGTYVQIMNGQSPGVRGLGRALGLQFVPGPWVQEIRLVKGIGSVIHGYESVTGQMAYQYLCPVDGPRLLLNAYGNTQTRWEGNAWFRLPVGKWRTGTALHASGVPNSMDNNGDGFMDQPTYRQFNLFHIWKLPRANGTLTEFSVQLVDEDRNGGQMAMEHLHHRYTLGMRTQRGEFNFRTGYALNPEKEWQTVAVFASAAYHRINGHFGMRNYTGEQRYGWVKALYKTIIGNTLHVLTMGPSFTYDEYNEQFDSLTLDRTEVIPGAFAEYTGTLSTKLSIVAGVRADWHSMFGLLVTPRVHLKYDIADRLNLRLGGGRGLHTPNVLVENLNVLNSNRQLVMRDPLRPEDAWNFGASAVWHFKLGKMPGYWGADFYRTQFTRQQVVDLDAQPQIATVSNLTGTSYANAAQMEVYFEPLEWLNFKAAYKFYDVKARYAGQLQQRPLVPVHRVMLTATLDRPRWMLNATMLWVGPQRLPSTAQFPTEFQRPDWSPSYVRVIGQATYRLGPKKLWEVYAGGENLTNFFVRDALISAQDPFNPYFDTSMAWGPLMGAMGYVGFRYKLP